MRKIIIKLIIAIIILAGLVGLGIWEWKTSDKATRPNSDNQSNENVSLTPREVVQKFLEADAAGARLSGKAAQDAPEIAPYFLFPSMNDVAMVIKKYEIIEEYPAGEIDSYFVKVKYFCEQGVASGFTGIEGEKIIKEVVGETTPGAIVNIPCNGFFEYICPVCFTGNTPMSFDLNQNTQTVTFKLIKDGNTWKVNFPSVIPHISQDTFEKHIEDLNE